MCDRNRKRETQAHSNLEILAGINHGKNEDKQLRWTKIGTGSRNQDGTIDLQFSYWPANAKKIQLRPIHGSRKRGWSNGN